jgi:tRNA G18 (ribose-2'-O)-methylase SpoU
MEDAVRRVDVSAGDARLEAYNNLTDVPVRSAQEIETGRFIIEGILVLERAVAIGITPIHVLVSERMYARVADLLASIDVDVLVASDELLETTTGYHVHRGVLAEAERPRLPELGHLVEGATLILMLEALRDHANVGAAFRNAAALGVDAVLVSSDCADPLYRRAVKTSMGAVLQVPWTRVDDWIGTIAALQRSGIQVVALTPAPDSLDLAEAAQITRPRALLIGTEGAGLRQASIDLADVRVRIPMRPGPDSLNAAAATAVALYAFGPSSASPRPLA